MARETPEQKVRREQRELMERLNAERDKKMTTRQQNDMRMRGAPPAPSRAAPAVPAPVPSRTNTARDRQIDRAVDRASRGQDPNARGGSNGGGGRGRR